MAPRPAPARDSIASPPPFERALGLEFRNHATVAVTAEGEHARVVAALLATAMGMRPLAAAPGYALHLVSGQSPAGDGRGPVVMPCRPATPRGAFLTLPPVSEPDLLASQLLHLSDVVACGAQAHGAFLVHGALAALDGRGVVLAGPSGSGKTTAARRLPPPWRVLCDDTTLVVRDGGGRWWGHPWPTWSRLFDARSGGACDLHESVPIMAVYALFKAGKDAVGPVGGGQALCWLAEWVEQVSRPMPFDPLVRDWARLRAARFRDLCAFVRAVPVRRLDLTADGPFWRGIGRSLAGARSRPGY